MNIDTKTILIAGLVGAVAYFATRKPSQSLTTAQLLALMQQQSLAQKPVSNTPQAIQAWVQTLIGTFGNVYALWQPGGPFYKPSPQVQQVLESMKFVKPF